jgi:rod shape determining protein RodA
MERPWFRRFNWLLALSTVALALFGVLIIHSADLSNPAAAGEWRKQLFSIVVGVGLMGAFAAFDYRRWQRPVFWLYGINLLLLALVMRGGHSALGAQRWISLGPLGTFQPSEPAKLVLAMTIAVLLARRPQVTPRDILIVLAAVAVPALLILKQPDLGTTLVIGAILTAELFMGVSNVLHFGVYAAAAAALAGFVVGTNAVLKPFQRNRLLIFLHPNSDPQGAGWNLNQSKIAVGSGGLFGKGLYRGTQTQLDFVPEHSRDFIFTVVGEELGYAGALCLLALYAILLFGGLRAAFAAHDRFGLLLAVGIVAMLAFHVVVNVGMTIGIMPITGIPLPFMSYGGSAILTDFIAVGILLNIQLQRDALVFDETRP